MMKVLLGQMAEGETMALSKIPIDLRQRKNKRKLECQSDEVK